MAQNRVITIQNKNIEDSTKVVFELLKKAEPAIESYEVIAASKIMDQDLKKEVDSINYSAYLPGDCQYQITQLEITLFEQKITNSRRLTEEYDAKMHRFFPHQETSFQFHFTNQLWIKENETYTIIPNPAHPRQAKGIADQLLQNPNPYQRDLVVCPIAKAGYGLFLQENAPAILKDMPLMIYAGEYIGEQNYQDNRYLGKDHYVIGHKDVSCRFSERVDGRRMGNLASFINHAPLEKNAIFSPGFPENIKKEIAFANVEFKSDVDQSSREIYFIQTCKPIEPGQQLLANYGYDPPVSLFFKKDNSSLIEKRAGKSVVNLFSSSSIAKP